MSPAQISEELKKIISYKYDRFQDSKMYSMRLSVLPTNSTNIPECELIIFIDSAGEKMAGLRLRFQVKGSISAPSPGASVDWLFGNKRAQSHVLVSNGQSVTKNFRIGADVLPGPLSLFVSAPISSTTSSLSLTVLVTPEILDYLEHYDWAEFRVNGVEYKVASASTSAPMSACVSGFTGYANNDLSKALPLARSLQQQQAHEDAKHSKNFRIGLIIIGVAIIASILATLYAAQNAPPQQAQPFVVESPSPSPSIAPKKGKRTI